MTGPPRTRRRKVELEESIADVTMLLMLLKSLRCAVLMSSFHSIPFRSRDVNNCNAGFAYVPAPRDASLPRAMPVLINADADA